MMTKLIKKPKKKNTHGDDDDNEYITLLVPCVFLVVLHSQNIHKTHIF